MNKRKDLVKIKKINKRIKKLKTKKKNVKLSDRNDLARNIMKKYPLIDYPKYDNDGYPVIPKKSDKSGKKNGLAKSTLYRYEDFVQYYQIIDKRKYVYLDKKVYDKQQSSLNNVNDYKKEIRNTQKQLNDTKDALNSTTDSLNKVKGELSNVKQQLNQARNENQQPVPKSNPQDNTESDIDSMIDKSNPFAKQNLSKTHEELQQERNNQNNNNNQ